MTISSWLCLFACAGTIEAQQAGVSGTVVLPTGDLAISATVKVRTAPDGATIDQQDVDSSGSYRFPVLGMGDYQIIAVPLTDYLPACGGPFHLPPNREHQDLHLQTKPKNPLNLSKYEKPHSFPPNFEVRLVPKCHDWDDQSGYIRTDAQGRAKFPPVYTAPDNVVTPEPRPHGTTGLHQPSAPAGSTPAAQAHTGGPHAGDEGVPEADDAQNQEPSAPPGKAPTVDAIMGKRHGIPLLLHTDEIYPTRFQVDPTTGVLTPVYTLPRSEKFKLHLHRMYDPVSLFLPALVGAINQARDIPYEWGQGAAGFGRRFASAYAYDTGVRNSMAFVLDSAFRQDPRYFPSVAHGASRLRDALWQTLVTHTDGGGHTFNVWRVGSAYGAGFLSNRWYPDRAAGTDDALIRGTVSLALDTTANVLREFLPEMSARPAMFAGSLRRTAESCRLDRFHRFFGILDCADSALNNPDLRPVFGNIAPGSGPAAGFSVSAVHDDTYRVHFDWDFTLAASAKQTYFLETALHIRMQAFARMAPIHVVTGPSAAAKLKPPRAALPVPFLNLYARRIYLRSQDFYGLGNDSSLAGKAQYREHLDEFGATLEIPTLSGWISPGATFELLRPHISPDLDSGVRPLQQVYADRALPGLRFQPRFMHYAPYLRFQSQDPVAWIPTILARYEFFQDLGQGNYAFRRLGLEAKREISLQRIPGLGCAGRGCTPAELILSGRVSLSDMSAGHAVPFYLQETLGGANFRGEDTLRGFADYRFRAPNLVLYQAEFRKSIFGPLGVMAFYDVGKVSALRSSIDFSHLRHDIGPGIYVNLAKRTILRMYVGFGSGEGTHLNAKMPNLF